MKKVWKAKNRMYMYIERQHQITICLFISIIYYCCFSDLDWKLHLNRRLLRHIFSSNSDQVCSTGLSEIIPSVLHYVPQQAGFVMGSHTMALCTNDSPWWALVSTKTRCSREETRSGSNVSLSSQSSAIVLLYRCGGRARINMKRKSRTNQNSITLLLWYKGQILNIPAEKQPGFNTATTWGYTNNDHSWQFL